MSAIGRDNRTCPPALNRRQIAIRSRQAARRKKWAREIACGTPERTRLGQCFGRGILGRERLPSIEASEQESGIDP
jgi:hypothetical protein